MAAFGELLKNLREERGLSQRALARAAQINPAIISRMESGDRGPSGPAQVRAIASALDLDGAQTDQLLVSAGYFPLVYLDLGPDDETVLAVARTLLLARSRPNTERRFRRTIEAISRQWAEEIRESLGEEGEGVGDTGQAQPGPAPDTGG
jgi:transcriptional regulator with XRE-family HTH domain